MTHTLIIDLDSTFWPAEEEYTRTEMRLFGTNDLRKNWYDNNALRRKYGANYKDIFWEALHPDRVMDRVPYPGATDAILDLHYGLGFDIHFISHNPFAEDMIKPLREWLDYEFRDSPAFAYKLTVYDAVNCKSETMRADPTAWGIVEDVPKTMERALLDGYNVFAKLQVWNEKYVSSRPEITAFTSWGDLPDLVAQRCGRIREMI